jgi:hypothetical protein
MHRDSVGLLQHQVAVAYRANGTGTWNGSVDEQPPHAYWERYGGRLKPASRLRSLPLDHARAELTRASISTRNYATNWRLGGELLK